MSLTKFNARIGDNLLEVLSSIQELKSLKHFNHAVLVLGANERDDEDGGIYYWYDNNTEENDDISVIQSNHNGNGRWKRLSFALNSSEDAPLNFEAESSKSVSFQQKNYSFGVASRFNVRATSDVDWITIGNIDKNELSHTINYSVSENINSSSRVGVITIKNGFNTFTYTITQDEVESVTGPAQLVYTNEERSNTIANITSNTSWSATTDADWISLITSSGNGNAPIQFDLTENNNQLSDRDGTITITSTSGYVSHTITISQSQAASTIQDVIDQTVDSDAATGLSFIVNSDIGWTATTNTDWITITTNTGDDGDSVVYSVTENTSIDNDRTGSITLTSVNNINVITVNIIQTQIADAFTFKIDTSLVSSNEFTISNTRNITIDWGDGSPKSSSTDTNTTVSEGFTHAYTTEGEYTISIKQNSEGCNFRIGSAYADAESPKMIKEILDWGDLKIDNLLYFMSHCSNLITLASDISDFDTSNVADMRYAWFYCRSLTSFPEEIDTSNVTDMRYAWYYCTSLTSFPSIDTSSVTHMTSTWWACTDLTSFPSIDTSSVTDMTTAWYNCSSLTSFPLINTSSVINMRSAWHNCSSLTSFPLIVTSSVINMRSAWHNCSSLTSFPLIVTSSVTNMAYAWYRCTSLTLFPLINTSSVTDMTYAWYHCTSLTSFPSIDTSSVTDMTYAWYHCTSLTSFPSIDVSSNTDFTRTWSHCRNLSTFNPFSNTTYTSAQWDRTWVACDNLTFTSVSNSPFADIGTTNTLPVSQNHQLISSDPPTYRNMGLYDPLPAGSTYYPPFDVSGVNAIYINDSGTTITDFNISGWDQMTFDRVNYGTGVNPTVEVDINAALANTEVDTILNGLHSNLANHTSLTGTNTYSINFHSNGRTSASNTAVNGLLSAGWDITLNNTLQLGASIQIGPKILDDDLGRDTFGTSVSMNAAGDRVIVGSPWDDELAIDSGQANIYEYTDGVGWTKLGQTLHSNAAGDHAGDSVSMNAAGDRVIVGAWMNDNNGTNAGLARVYEYSNGSWTQLGSDIAGEAAGDNAGGSVSINAVGNIVAIGASLNDGGGSNAGHTRIYEYSNGSWSQLGSDIDGGDTDQASGHSVSLNNDGDRVAIGTPHTHNNNRPGLARVYEYSNGSWTQLGSDIAGEAAGDKFGISVSINAEGDRVAIGAYFNNDGGSNAGHTRIYEYSNGSWSQLGTDIDGGDVLDYSGRSVSLNNDGDRVAIGAYGNYGSTANTRYSGKVRILEYSNNTWTPITQDILGDARDYLGLSVSMNAAGNRIAIGAPEGGGGDLSYGYGYVQVYQI